MRRSDRVGEGWRIGRGRIAWRRVARLASTGLILRPNINNKSFRSLSRGVALNGKRTIARGREKEREKVAREGRGGGKRNVAEHTVARDVRVFYTTTDGGTVRFVFVMNAPLSSASPSPETGFVPTLAGSGD